MPFPYDRYPWLNFQELNLSYFIKHFREIFQQWAQLLEDMQSWKDSTTEELESWKAAVDAGLDSWKAGVESGLDDWKNQTETDISTWEAATLAALNAWQAAATAAFEQIRTEAAASATAAAGSAVDAALARSAAQDAQEAAEAAADSISTSAAQIGANTGKIIDLQANIVKIYDDMYAATPGVPSWEQGSLTESGATTPSDIRIRLSNYVPVIPYKISVETGYKMRIAFYSRSASTGNYSFNSFSEWFEGDYELLDHYGLYFKAIFGKNDNSPITPDESSNAAFLGYRPIEYATREYVDSIAYTEESLPVANTPSSYWSIENGTTAVFTDAEGARFYASNPITVTPGEIYELTARQGNTDKTRIWILTDDDYNIITMCENFKGTAYNTTRFVVPDNATKLLLTKQGQGSTQILLKFTTALDILLQPVLYGKKFSLMGDSISAYAGTIPEGNDAYYTGSNSGVSSPNQMWWKILCDKTGMTPLVINAWSGSGVTQLEDSAHINKVPMSSDVRCAALGADGQEPDIIIIAGGTNDYSYAQSAQSEPLAWDGHTAPDISANFTEAYACMIHKIHTNYPNAIIVALSTWFTKRGTDNGYTYTHSVGDRVYSQADYNAAIQAVCEQMHIPYIDISAIGFNRFNYYPLYAQDTAGATAHPNAKGQRVIAESLVSLLPALVKGFAE